MHEKFLEKHFKSALLQQMEEVLSAKDYQPMDFAAFVENMQHLLAASSQEDNAFFYDPTTRNSYEFGTEMGQATLRIFRHNGTLFRIQHNFISPKIVIQTPDQLIINEFNGTDGLDVLDSLDGDFDYIERKELQQICALIYHGYELTQQRPSDFV